MLFEITEESLTNALWCNTTLDAVGSGSKAEARAQARRMLSADNLLATCKTLLALLDDPSRELTRPEQIVIQAARNGVAKAEQQ